MQAADKVIPAIHADDLVAVLERYGLIDGIRDMSRRCTECSKTLTLGNLGSVRRLNGELVFTCNNILCYYNVVSRNKK